MTATPRLAAFDLDGTLLNADSAVSSLTRDVLAELATPDRHFVVATGRGHDSASQRLEGIAEIRWAVCDNGAALYDLSTGELVSYDVINPDASSTLLRQLGQHVPGVAFCWGSLSNGFAWTPEFAKLFGGKVSDRPIVDSSEPIPDDALKILLAHPDHSVEELLDQIDQRGLNELGSNELAITTSGHSFVEITASGVDKSRRLSELCQRLEVDQADTVAFGDAMNDYAMLQWVGTGYAMANAQPGIKTAADAVTERTNDDDGVAHALQAIFS